jgi:hypothetical protein
MSAFHNDDVVLGGIPILRADRKPCPVCEHPTGDCSTDTARPMHIAFTDSVLETLKDSQMILVEENIYEDRQITPFTKTTVITVHKGSYVTLERAQELGIS